ncbi:MAG: four helix bundle protein [Chloroflexi bacterium]|nr:four helix bundle protein [Chloroflexota bacterium]
MQTGKEFGAKHIGSEFRQMALWQKAQDFAAAVAQVVGALPARDRVAETIGGQLLRAAASVPANIAEGYGRFSQAAYRSHLSIARGSAFEAESWLDLLSRQGLLSAEDAVRLLDQCTEVQKAVTLRMKSLGETPKTYAKGNEGGKQDKR